MFNEKQGLDTAWERARTGRRGCMDAVPHVAECADGDADGLLPVVEGRVAGDVVHGGDGVCWVVDVEGELEEGECSQPAHEDSRTST